jgi:allophanate hydrolase subunit 1
MIVGLDGFALAPVCDEKRKTAYMVHTLDVVPGFAQMSAQKAVFFIFFVALDEKVRLVFPLMSVVMAGRFAGVACVKSRWLPL